MPLRVIKDETVEVLTASQAPGGGGGLLTFHERKLMATPARVVIRPFHLG